MVATAPYSLADLAAGVHETLADAFGVPVTYRRGATTKSITAVPARTATEIGEAPTGMLRAPEQQTDWKIEASDLETEFGDPQRGDQLEITIRETVQTWEVLRPENLGLAAEWTDHARTWARVHTKLTKLVRTFKEPAGAELSAEAI